MRAIVAEAQPFVREEHTIDEGLALFADQPYKREIIEGVARRPAAPPSTPSWPERPGGRFAP